MHPSFCIPPCNPISSATTQLTQWLMKLSVVTPLAFMQAPLLPRSFFHCTLSARSFHVAMPANLLITWDIDGTLLRAGGKSGNAAHKRALEDAIQTVYNVRTLVNEVPHAGCTDRAIMRDMCLKGGVPERTVHTLLPKAIEEADKNIVKYVESDMSHFVLPGVKNLLERLQQDGVKLALTTGNLQSCAWAKLKAAGLDLHFDTGGFGSDCLLREEILKTAIERVEKSGEFERRVVDGKVTNVFHVGDARADMHAARVNGVGGIGVLTGTGTREEFAEEEAVAVFEDLADFQRFVKIVGVQ